MALTFLVNISASAQEGYYFISFRDKDQNANVKFSERGAYRRSLHRITNDFLDLPVSSSYVDQVSKSGAGIVLVSKWLNGVLVLATDHCIQNLKSQSYVGSAVWLGKQKVNFFKTALQQVKLQNNLDYGNASYQIKSLKGDVMHDACLDGTGVYIAVFDGGFENADKLNSLSHIFLQNRLRFTYNMVDKNEYVYTRHTHGTNVLSCLGGYTPGKLIGTSYGADYALFITEDVRSEKKIEEYYWLKAAEMADSLGVDIISSSLGYYSFDNSTENHQLEELDGKTTVITKAALLAARKGILVVNSAGNNYTDNSWRKIVFPCDADSILSVGAVDSKGQKASFSAVGPTADGRVKPEISAIGVGVIINSVENYYTSASGTSYSAPLVAGIAAGLWQSNPEFTNIQVRNALIRSANNFTAPTNETGYGIPDFEVAYRILNNKEPRCQSAVFYYRYFPNPVNDMLTIEYSSDYFDKSFLLFDISGKALLSGKIGFDSFTKLKIDMSGLLPGVYFLKIGNKLQKIIKN